MLNYESDTSRDDRGAGDGTTNAVLFVTRKYPPRIGGMEEFSYRLAHHYPGRRRILATAAPDWQFPLFAAWALSRARQPGQKYQAVHLGDGMLAPLAPLFGRLTGAPVAITLHGQEITREVPGYQAILRRAIRDHALQPVAVSTYTAAECEARFGVSPAVIHNGVNLERFRAICRQPNEARARLGLPVEGHLIVAVGRLVRRKGIAWFIDEVVPLLSRDTHFCVIGDGPDVANVRAAAARDARVHWLGSRSDADVDLLYSVADLFVAPNIVVPGKPEGFGIAPAEAAAASIPVLVSHVEGLRDMASVYGIPTVRPGDARAWAAEVSMTLALPSRALASVAPRGWDDVGRDYARFFAALSRNSG